LEAILEQSQPVDEATGKTLPSAMNSEGDQPAAQPVLFSKAELAYYSNLKKGVIENLISYHDELYTEVEGGIVNYKKRRLNVDRFIIRNISVTNMEYKVFLVDLFTNRNTKALEVALVNNEGWIYHQCNQLGDQYFQGHQYDGFPVVNISADAMALYCEWLDKEVNAYLIATKSKSKPLKIRLPYTYEWIHAAYTGAARMADCAGHYTIFSLSEGYVNKAFVNRVEKLRKKDRSEATRWDTLASINRYGMGESEILQLFQSVAPTISNDTPFQEYPTGLLKIGKAAHVSELNQEEDGDRTVVVGCWSSKEEYWGMLREFNALSASPFVGFRFVIDDGRRQTYVQPLWR
ncbi:MAG: SUMF1/EgtB/PvdO family nonheme iron enzyme, partial [Salibacteraceae bacterium]